MLSLYKDEAEHVLRKIHRCTFGDLFRILPQHFTCYPSKILMTFFSHCPFLRFSSLSYFIPLSRSLTPHFRPKNFLTTLLGFYPEILHFLSLESFDDLF